MARPSEALGRESEWLNRAYHPLNAPAPELGPCEQLPQDPPKLGIPEGIDESFLRQDILRLAMDVVRGTPAASDHQLIVRIARDFLAFVEKG